MGECVQCIIKSAWLTLPFQLTCNNCLALPLSNVHTLLYPVSMGDKKAMEKIGYQKSENYIW